MDKRLIIKIFRRVANGFRFSVGKFSNISVVHPQYNSLSSEYRTFGGVIRLKSGCCIEGNTLLQATRGTIHLGRNVYVNRNSMIICRESISIGNNTSIGPNVCIYDHDHDYKMGNGEMLTTSVVIGDNVWIGSGCIILRGTIIESGCVIGAGTILKGHVSANSLIYNSPNLKRKPISR